MTENSSPRNLVVCCDGTGNVWGNSHDTNVVKLARECVKDNHQIIYYDPGVGTASGFPPVGVIDELVFKVKLLVGLAMGGGIYENIGNAYGFLVANYRPGDRIFLFGFSRGAFTARSVSGMVNLFGIVRPAGEVMIPTLLRIYFSDADAEKNEVPTRDQLANDIRQNFTDPVGHEARVYFIGVWDTVATVGGLRSRTISSNASTANKRFDHVRHAVSDGEYRATYAPRLYEGANRDSPGYDQTSTGAREYRPSLKQLWFPGVHSDVGGSYAQAGLSDVALSWMLDEARALGLRLHEKPVQVLHPDPMACAHDQAFAGATGPWWALTGLQRRALESVTLWHQSLREREAKPQLSPVTYKALWKNPVFVLPLLAALALLGVESWLLAGVSPAEGTGASDLVKMQLLAFRLDHQHGIAYAGHLATILWLDVLLILAYAHVLCVGCVYTVKRLRDWHADSPATHRALRVGLWLALLVAPIANIAQDLLTNWYVNYPGTWNAIILSSASALKWAALGILTALFGIGAAFGRAPKCQCNCPQ
jgi:uncharacterized protein (DUF2235 family)